MVLTGTVTEKTVVGEQAIIDVDVIGKNSIGNHVTGTVRLALPQGN